jgi:N-acetylmuramoyl-L-alanine amidase
MQLSTKGTTSTALALLLLAACAPPGRVAGPALPPIPFTPGPLDITVVYPTEGQTLGVRDSTFIFGNVRTGQAALAINGARVEVEPNGAFLAFLPVPENGVYELVATAGGQTERATVNVEVPARPVPAAMPGRLFLVPGSHMPRGAFTLGKGEPVTVSFRGTPGARARVVLPGGEVLPLAEQPVTERAQGFMLDQRESPVDVAEYIGTFPAREIRAGRDTAFVELIRGADTVRTALDLSLEVLLAGRPRVGVAASERADRTVIGTAVPGSGTPYHWFFPNGARLAITGARGGQYRVGLTGGLSVWVDTSEVRLLPAGTPAPEGWVGTVRAIDHPGYVDLRLSTSERLPFRVDPGEEGLTVTVYGAETRTNWLQYGQTSEFIERMEWEQPADDVYRVHVELEDPLWGYVPFYDEAGNLVVRIRKPPEIDRGDPLEGLYIGVDAGHPPGGAVGPTGFTEARANLLIAKRLIRMLEERGARVLEIRPDTTAVGLGARPRIATDSSVHLLVSVHNNAFPDGVNPFENNGTSVFYNQAQSLELARALQDELLQEFRLRDLGIARADLALVRPTWFPSALTETMFLMIPRQEAALKDPEVQERIARAHLRGIVEFLRERTRQ